MTRKQLIANLILLDFQIVPYIPASCYSKQHYTKNLLICVYTKVSSLQITNSKTNSKYNNYINKYFTDVINLINKILENEN